MGISSYTLTRLCLSKYIIHTILYHIILLLTSLGGVAVFISERFAPLNGVACISHMGMEYHHALCKTKLNMMVAQADES